MNRQAERLIELKRLEDGEKITSHSKIISVCSGKGGTGKTFFAANFAYQLSQMKKKILLIDLDLNFSNINILLNRTTENTISKFFEQKKQLDELVYSHSQNLDIISGDSGREDYPRVSKEIIDYFFSALSKISSRYDFIMIDSSAGADEILIHQLLRSDYNIIVASTEPTAVMDAYVIVKLLKEHSSSSEKIVVINKCTNEEEADSAFGNLSVAAKHFLGEESLRFLGSVSFDFPAHRSIMDQELLIKYTPQAKSALDFLQLAERFIKIEQVANNNQPKFSRL